jgi:hypothetical protein
MTTSATIALENMAKLQRMDLMIKARNGSVLSRGFILKTDFYPTGAFPLFISFQSDPEFPLNILNYRPRP